MGRKTIEIDWKQAKQLAQAGCNGVQIAAFFGVSEHTIYRACKRDNKVSFANWLLSQKERGNAMLLAKQYESALQDKDRAMLIWLGKQRLDQREKRDYDHTTNGQALPPIQYNFTAQKDDDVDAG